MDTEIVMVMTEAEATRSTTTQMTSSTSHTTLDDVFDEVLGHDVTEGQQDEKMEVQAEPNPMEMMGSMDGTGQTYIPQGEQYRIWRYHTPQYGEEQYDIQQAYHPSDQQLSPNLQYDPQQMGAPGPGGPHPGAPHEFQTPMNPAPCFPPPNFDIPDISLSNSVTGGPSPYPTSSAALMTTASRAMMGQDGTQKSPLREGSSDSDDSIPLAQLVTRSQVAAQAAAAQAAQYGHIQPGQGAAPKKARSPKKGKKKKDPNEPQKPVSAYAMFFRDTQAAIKSQNPNATFGEVSKIVASMWDNLGVDCKNVYKKKTELAKKEYLKQLAVYRASLVSKQSPYDYGPDGSGQMMVNSPPGDVNKQLAQLQEMAQVASHLSSPSRLEGGQMVNPHQQHMSPPQGSPQQHMSPQGAQQHMSPPHMQHMSPNGMMHMSPPQGGQEGQGSPMGQAGQHGQMIQPGMDPNGYPTGVSGSDQNGYCVRKGCQNTPLDGPNYENTYCSNECVVTHCRDVFQNWVANRQSTSYASVK